MSRRGLARITTLAILAWTAMAAAGPADAVLQGQVTDLRGRPLAEVAVSAESWQRAPLGSARSDGQGKFRIAMARGNFDITLIAEPPGYSRFALTGFKADGAPVQVRLTRKIDVAYLQELTRAADDRQFREQAADLLAPSDGTVGELLPLEDILPVLGALVPRLRGYLPADVAQISRRDLPRDQDRALLLLSWWSDPADDAKVDAWGTAQKIASRPSRRCSGPTLQAALQAWEALHFAKEGYKPGTSTPYASVQIAQAPSGDRAVVTHSVRYAHWGYSQRIIIVREKGVWEVRRILAHERWHGRD